MKFMLHGSDNNGFGEANNEALSHDLTQSFSLNGSSIL